MNFFKRSFRERKNSSLRKVDTGFAIVIVICGFCSHLFGFDTFLSSSLHVSDGVANTIVLFSLLLMLYAEKVITCVIEDWYGFFDMDRLPKGAKIGSYTSPNGIYIVNAYICGGNATTGEAVRCELVNGTKSKNIYWKYKESSVECNWISDTVVEINGIQLDVTRDTYDWRRN